MVGTFASNSGFADALLVPGDGAFSALALHLGHQLLLAPAHLRGQVSQGAELAEVTQLDASHSIRHAESLLGIVRSGHSFEDFEATHGDGTACSLVGDHAADGAPEDTGGRAVVDESAGGVG